jgi:hypothetical protein
MYTRSRGAAVIVIAILAVLAFTFWTAAQKPPELGGPVQTEGE